MPPEFYKMSSQGYRNLGVIVVIATILAHGALITSIGLALAVWMKRLGRAIAFTVGFAIVIGAVWPILVTITMNGTADRGIGLCLPQPHRGASVQSGRISSRLAAIRLAKACSGGTASGPSRCSSWLLVYSA